MNTTIAAISTGQAPGGLGVIRVSGPQAFEICDKVFHSKFRKRISEMPGYTAALGEVYGLDGEKLDDCVALVFRGPKSYTGEDVVELSSHGGLYIMRQILERVLDSGAVAAGPGEFTCRAFLNGKIDLTQAESVMGIIGAEGKQMAQVAAAAGSGNLSKRIGEIRKKLENLAAHLAAWADFPEEDVEELTIYEVKDLLLWCREEMGKMIDEFDKRKVYREGLRTVIVGCPNVGKSTLMNLLAGRERSIVTPIAGTTRDVVEERILLAGVPLLLADTAGIHDTEDPVEKIGVAAAKRELKAAELVLAVFDLSQEVREEDLRLIEKIQGYPVIAVLNKTDLDHKFDMELIKNSFSYWVETSAELGKGLDELERVFTQMIGTETFHAGSAELFTDRQRNAAFIAKTSLEQGLEALDLGLTLDAVTVCVEDALSTLFQLTGENVSEEIISQVFEQFCVGK